MKKFWIITGLIIFLGGAAWAQDIEFGPAPTIVGATWYDSGTVTWPYVIPTPPVNNDVYITGNISTSGSLTANTAGSGNIYVTGTLNASLFSVYLDAGGLVNDNAAGTIQCNLLQVNADGGIIFMNPQNAAIIRLANTGSGDILFFNSRATVTAAAQNNASSGTILINETTGALVIGTVNSLSGIESNDGLIALFGTAGITGNQPINAGTATIFLTSGSGSINCTGSILTGSNLEANASNGSISLNNVLNAVTSLNVTNAGGTVTFYNNAGFNVVGIIAGGYTTTLTSTGAVTQSGPILCSTLQVSAAGGIDFSAPPNTVTQVSLTNTGSGNIIYTNDRALGLTAAASNSASGGIISVNENSGTLTVGTVGTVIGVTASNGAVQLRAINTTGGSVTVNQPVNAGTGTASISAYGTTVGQVAAGIITAGELRVIAASGIVLGAANNNADNVYLSNISGDIDYRSSRTTGTSGVTVAASTPGTIAITEISRGITAGTVNSLNGVTSTSNGNITLTASNTTNGSITINQPVNAGTALATISASGTTVNEGTATGIITAGELRVTAISGISLLMATNNAENVYLNNTGTGSIYYNSSRTTGTSGLTVAARTTGIILISEANRGITVGSVNGLNGVVSTSNGNITLTASNTTNGSITINQPVNGGTGITTISASGTTVGQGSGAAVTAGELRVNAVTGISLSLTPNNAAQVSLNNTGTGIVTYNTNRTASTTVAANGNGIMAITATAGELIVGSVGLVTGITSTTQITLTGNGISGSSPVTTPSLLQLIANPGAVLLDGANAVGVVTVNPCTGFTFVNTVPLTTNAINTGATGTVTITNGDTITVSGTITAANVYLKTDNTANSTNNNITIGGTHTITSLLNIISGDLVAGIDYCGTVAVNSSISIPGASTIHIEAGEITLGGGASLNGGSGTISFLIDELSTGDLGALGTITPDPSIGPRHFGALVYYTSSGNLGDSHFPTNATRISSASWPGNFNFTNFSDVYLVDVNDSEDRTVTVTTGSFIEFYNSYTYSGTPPGGSHLNLTASGGIRSYHQTDTSGVTTIDMGDNSDFSVDAITIFRGSLSIRANGIVLTNTTNSITRAYASQNNHLTLYSISGSIPRNIDVAGALGTGSTGRLGYITVTNAATAEFNGEVWAARFSQSAGSVETIFNELQNYQGDFSFTGTALTLNNALTTSNDGAITITNSGLFTKNSTGIIQSQGSFLQNGTGGCSIGGEIRVTGMARSLRFEGNLGSNVITITDNVTFRTNEGAISIFGNSAGQVVVHDGTARNLSLISNPGSITLGRTGASVSTVDLLTGTLTVTGGTITTTDTAPLNILNIGSNGTTNATNLNVSSGTLGLKNSLTVWGTTTNSGTINAAPLGLGSTAITFYGNYNGNSGNLNGNSTNNHYIYFMQNAALGKFTHNGDVIVFDGPVSTTHNLSQNYTTGDLASGNTLGRVEIRADNTVTLTSDINQNSANQPATPTLYDRTLFMASNAVLNTGAFTWRMGTESNPVTLPPGVPVFTEGFYGYLGDIVFNYDGARLETEDFYTVQNTGAPNTAPYHRVILPAAAGNMATISASGNVFIQETFSGTLLNSTLEMTGTGGMLSVRINASGVPQVDIGHFAANAGTAGTNWTAAPPVEGTVINTNIRFLGTVTVKPDRVLTVIDSPYSALDTSPGPGPQIYAENNWIQEISGTQRGRFYPQYSIVEFGNENYNSPLLPGNTPREFIISGDTTWYILACHENQAKLKFSNYSMPGTGGHVISGMLIIKQKDSPPVTPPGLPVNFDNFINLTRANDTLLGGPYDPYPSTPTYIPPDTINQYFWLFNLSPSGKMDLDDIVIKYSFSSIKIPVPRDVETGGGAGRRIYAFPYVLVDTDSSGFPIPLTPNYYHPTFVNNCWSVNWFVLNSFFYAFTEDSDHNGRIDRVRLQAAFNLNGDFSGFRVSVRDAVTKTPYKVKEPYTAGYRLVQDNTSYGSYDLDSIYVFLEEQSYQDAGAILEWEIAENTSLYDSATGQTIVGNPPPQSSDAPSQDRGITTDSVPPRVNYAFAVPGHNQIYFRISKPVDSAKILASVSAPFSIGPVLPVRINDREYVIDLGSNSYNIIQLAGGANVFSLNNLEDRAVPAEDLHAFAPNRPYHFMYPMPKYPQNYYYDLTYGTYTYQPYVPVSDNDLGATAMPGYWNNTSYPWASVTVIPLADSAVGHNTDYDLLTGAAGAGTNHRVTDMLISVPPETTADTGYFVWPLWAKYGALDPALDDLLGTQPAGPGGSYGYMGQGPDEFFIETEIIWDFTGKRFLEWDTPATMQARVNTGLTITPTLQLVPSFNVPDMYKSTRAFGSPDLWHPDPKTLDPALTAEKSFVNMVPEFYNPYNLGLPSAASSPLYNYEFNNGSTQNKRTWEFYFLLDITKPDLLAGRLAIAPGEAIPGNWYTLVRPYKFDIHDITRQRGGVTILNNVINSNNRERVYIDYRPDSSGRVTIQVFTLDGNLVKIIKRGSAEKPGEINRVSWDGTNQGGRPVARGLYFIRVVAPGIDEIRKVMVIK